MSDTTKSNSFDFKNVDLTNCDREPIQFLGHVQSFACMISVTSDWLIVQASKNTIEHLGMDAETLIGQPFRNVVSKECLHDLRSRMQMMWGDDAVERLFSVKLREDLDTLFDIAMHRSGRQVIIELQPTTRHMGQDQGNMVRSIMGRLQSEKTVEGLCRQAARFVRALTGFDRVMVYRFLPDDSGQVIAETAKTGLEPYLGLRYPATDIPKQARELYKRNLLRIIADVNDRVSPILPQSSDQGALDLSLCTARAVSPIHLEYLRNMGVQASLSISILKRGKLWGLFACHHYEPRILEYDVRSTAELFGQMFSFVLEQVETDIEREEMTRARVLHDQLMGQLAEGESLEENFEMISNALRSLIKCDGVALWVDGKLQKVGHGPNEEEFAGLARFLNTHASSQVYTTDNISEVYPPGEMFVNRAAGMLALPVSRSPRDYIVLFRGELTKEIKWAGNPDKPVTTGPLGTRLTPRKSFEVWKQTVSGTSESWTEAEIAAAETLRVTLLEVVLRISDAANQERAKAQDRQEILIAELNHRVRNILNLIRSLIKQSQSEARTVSEFTEIVGGRVHALARAHDQLTKQNWESGSLRDLIETETEAYIPGTTERVTYEGPDILFHPNAFSTMALVLHELTTNSVKYGALSRPSGKISILAKIDSAGGLTLSWKEAGGPVVSAPTRVGFGSTVIERSIPFELQGEAKQRFHTHGLEAEFFIPEKHIEIASPVAKAKAPDRATIDDTVGSETPLSGQAIVVEDNMIIAFDSADILRHLGASEVEIASNADEAFALLEAMDPGFMLLDVNLGMETSEMVARKAVERGIPFIFASGYGETASVLEHFDDPMIIQKPYDEDMIRRAILKLQRKV